MSTSWVALTASVPLNVALSHSYVANKQRFQSCQGLHPVNLTFQLTFFVFFAFLELIYSIFHLLNKKIQLLLGRVPCTGWRPPARRF